ncbi:TonB-dependent receptor [Olivibacter sp. SDN3]|uniref:SusC/RagA family TonB-linked outer membrane protein n=1 Tax=Olivibacter sp. SDN3 TaxID=2764720 RepID=UPI0016519A8E|nr:TonB-dependent receptor [Olivibacter sp. SDN3]QNL52246.1 TonB-dependent receptor [Olivibacter sp. SDN3]
MRKNEVLIYLYRLTRRIPLFVFIIILVILCSDIRAFAFVNLPNGPYTVVINQASIKGSVRDRNGDPIAGATIKIKNEQNSVTTDDQGKFQLQVPSTGSVLMVSYVGFATQEVAINGRDEVAIILEENASELDEVVVIGYGTTKKRDLTGSVASIKSEEIVLTPTHNPLEAMQGRVPGLDITRSSGQAGAGVDIVLRGNRSITASNEPLYIIDGFQGGSIDDLNPNDIESIDVLKDASATAIYGSQGANGVIIVTTKKGMAGKAKVSLNSYYGINGLTPYPDVRLFDDYVQLRREAWRYNGQWTSPADDPNIFANEGEWEAIQNGNWINWPDLLLQNGSMQNHTISVRGGSEKTKVFFSGGFFQEDGILRNDNMKRFNGRFNVEHDLNRWAKVGMLGQLTYSNINRRTSNLLANAVTASPFGRAFDDNGDIVVYPNPANPSFPSVLTDERGSHIATDNTLRSNIILNTFLELKPVEGLTIRSNFGTNFTNDRRGQFDHETSWRQRNTNFTEASMSKGSNKFFNFDNIVSYAKTFGEHDVTVTGITNYIQNEYEFLSATGRNQPLSSQLFYNLSATDQDSRLITSNYTKYNMMSYAGRINYTFKNKYIFTITNRFDGASRLAPGNKWNMFPSVAGAWVVSDERFMDKISLINFMKLRASYGVAGNSAVDPYGTQNLVYANNRLAFGEVPAATYLFEPRIGNQLLGWENSATTNFGLDLELLNQRLTATIDYYNTVTTDLILERTLPQLTGVASVYQNIGSTNNKGLEIKLNSQNIQASNFSWNTALTYTRNRERITGLIDDVDIIDGLDNSLLLGRPVNSFYGFKKLGIWQSDEAEEAASYTYGGANFTPGDVKILDVDGNSIIDNNDRMYLGSNVPKGIIGLQNNFRYKAFDLGLFIIGRWGQTIDAEILARYMADGERNGPAAFNYWTPENPTNDFPRPRRNNLSAYPIENGVLTIVDGSFLKIKNISLGYNMPSRIAQKIFADKIRIYATGSNLFVFSKSHLLRDYDPERGGAEADPLNRQIVFGVNIDF